MKFSLIKNNQGINFKGPIILHNEIFSDQRGFFFESWNENLFNQTLGYQVSFVQDNISISSKGVIRGMHFQLPDKEQGKLVRCLTGNVFDVIIDLRKKSETFATWAGVEINNKNNYQIWIPHGFAHGFLSMEENTIFQYKVTNYWSKSHEQSLLWDDKEIDIKWPNVDKNFKLSKKDLEAKSFQYLKSKDLYF
tara:strand:+ start:1639 stop:2217 length:579 start_codon:yes stop_codon:yes gene_type:complete